MAKNKRIRPTEVIFANGNYDFFDDLERLAIKSVIASAIFALVTIWAKDRSSHGFKDTEPDMDGAKALYETVLKHTVD